MSQFPKKLWNLEPSHFPLGSIIANIEFVIPAMMFMCVMYKFYKKLQNNEKANEVTKIIRTAALAVLVVSSTSIFKNAFFNNFQLNNLLFCINFKSIILAIFVYFFQKKIKINTLIIMMISALAAGICNV